MEPERGVRGKKAKKAYQVQLHDESLPVEQCVEGPGRSRAGSGDCLSHPPSHHAHLQVLGSWYPQCDTRRFVFCKNAELGYLESGQPMPLPLCMLWCPQGSVPACEELLGLGNAVPRRTVLVITMLGSQRSLCSPEATGKGLRLEETQENLV